MEFLFVARPPDVLQDHSAGTDFANVVGEVGEELELLGREIEGVAVEGGLVMHEVEVKGSDDQLG